MDFMSYSTRTSPAHPTWTSAHANKGVSLGSRQKFFEPRQFAKSDR
jgi:hypothetical protein